MNNQKIGFKTDNEYKGEKIIYYFVREDGKSIEKDDYGKFISALNASEGVAIYEQKEHTLKVEIDSGVFAGKTYFRPVVADNDQYTALGLPDSRIEIATERSVPTINAFKYYAGKLNWKIYPTKLRCYLPKSDQ